MSNTGAQFVSNSKVQRRQVSVKQKTSRLQGSLCGKSKQQLNFLTTVNYYINAKHSYVGKVVRNG